MISRRSREMQVMDGGKKSNEEENWSEGRAMTQLGHSLNCLPAVFLPAPFFVTIHSLVHLYLHLHLHLHLVFFSMYTLCIAFTERRVSVSPITTDPFACVISETASPSMSNGLGHVFSYSTA